MPSVVHLSRLSLRYFRNLGVQELTFPPEGVAIVGENAQGKSNLLEAIYYLETFRSFRGAREEQMVAFDQPVFRVAATMGRAEGESRKIAGAYERQGRRKKVTLDGLEPDRIGDALGHLGAVIFSPADVDVVSGGPVERRRFLNIVLSLNRPRYLGALQRFRHALHQRNAALKSHADGEAVAAWNELLVQAGSEVMWIRQEWVRERAKAFARYYATISGGQTAEVRYVANVGKTVSASSGCDAELRDPAAWQEIFRDALDASRDREQRMGTTVTGPHRDDLVMAVGEQERVSIRDYGSGGQRRTAALALRLVEADTIRDVRKREPVILMDDVFAELDPGRSERVLVLLEEEHMGQVILAAPKESDIRLRRETLARWSIRDGAVSA